MVITISCPSCQASFPVDPAKIPAGGVRVRCSACAHVFRVEKPEPEAALVQEPGARSGPAAGSAGPGQVAGVGPDATPGAAEESWGDAQEAGDRTHGDDAEGDGFPVRQAFDERQPLADHTRGPSDDAIAEPTDDPFADGGHAHVSEPAADSSADVLLDPAAGPTGDAHLQPAGESAAGPAGDALLQPAAESLDDAVVDSPAAEPSGDVVPDLAAASTEPGGDAFHASPSEPPEGPPPSSEAGVGHTAAEQPSATSVQGFTFGKRDPTDKARRLARVLVSDMIMYNAERHQVALAQGTLAEDFEEEIDKSWKEYVEQVGPRMAEGEGRGFWVQALNDILAKGRDVF